MGKYNVKHSKLPRQLTRKCPNCNRKVVLNEIVKGEELEFHGNCRCGISLSEEL